MLNINPEFSSLIPPLTDAEFETLEQSILHDGIRDAIVTWNGYIIDGHNRYKIAQKYGLQFATIEMQFESIYDVKDWMFVNQLGRRNLTELQKTNLIGQRYNNQKQRHGGDRKSKPQNEVLISTSEAIADEYNVSRATVERAADFATGLDHTTPELKQDILQGKVKVNKGDVQELAKAEPFFVAQSESDIIKKAKEIRDKKNEQKIIDRKIEIEQQLKDIEENKLPQLNGLYHVISVDPPWPYGREYNPETSRVANPYPEMSISDIKGISLPFMDDAILFLWTTHQFLPDAFEIIKHWGFEYKATIVWNKEKIGMGAWFRMQCEFCLFAIKGKPYWVNTTERDIINEARREHSRKPDSFFDMVDKLVVGRKLEYFSREARNGWNVFGNDLNKF